MNSLPLLSDIFDSLRQLSYYLRNLEENVIDYRDILRPSKHAIILKNSLIVRFLTDPSPPARLYQIFSRVGQFSLFEILAHHIEATGTMCSPQTRFLIPGVQCVSELKTVLANKKTRHADDLEVVLRKAGGAGGSVTTEVLALLTVMGTEIQIKVDGGNTRTLSVSVASALDFLYRNSSTLAKDVNGYPLYTTSLSDTKPHNLSSHRNWPADILLQDDTIRPVINTSSTTSNIPLDTNELNLKIQKNWRQQQTTHTWIQYLLAKENIPPESVCEVGPYHPDLHLTYKRPDGIPATQAGELFIGFLEKRFNLIFELADTLLKLFEVATEFDTTNFSELTSWAGIPRVLMNSGSLYHLPIVQALDKNLQEIQLYFRVPFIKMLSDEEIPLLSPIKGLTDQSKEVILDIFFNRIVLSKKIIISLSREPHTLFFLRPRDEMLNLTSELSRSARIAIESVDFYDYLESMGYPNMKLHQLEYRGYFGLLKAVEHHTLSHLLVGGLTAEQEQMARNPYPWPFYYPSLVKQQE